MRHRETDIARAMQRGALSVGGCRGPVFPRRGSRNGKACQNAGRSLASATSTHLRLSIFAMKGNRMEENSNSAETQIGTHLQAARELHAILSMAIQHIKTKYGEAEVGLRGTTAFAIGETCGILAKAKALVESDIDRLEG